MLSPHEFATLMLVSSAPDQVDMARAELDTLLERQLISLESLAEGLWNPALTEAGHSVLRAAHRARQRRSHLYRQSAESTDEPV
jgi:hypothetical protein